MFIRNTGSTISLPGKARRHFRLLCLLAAVFAAVFAFSGPLQAQEGAEHQYVDLVMSYEHSESIEVYYSVRNAGTQTATGVAVSFLLEDMSVSTFNFLKFITLRPTITDHRTVDQTNQTFTWEIGTLSPGETSKTLSFATADHRGLLSGEESIGVITATAKSHQPELDFLSSNNVAKLYSFLRGGTGIARHMKENKLALLLSVDDLRPDAGGDVDFGLAAKQEAPEGNSLLYNVVDEIEIRVELSEGLEFKAGWTRPTGFTTVGRSATWTPEAVSRRIQVRPLMREIEIEVQLTSDSLDAIPLEERCITAWLEDSIPPPNPDYVLGSLKQCLGDDPKVLFQSGELDLFTLYSCVGVTQIAYPCRDDNSDSTVDNGMEMVAGADIRSQLAPRAQGVGRKEDSRNVYLMPGSVVVQVEDPGGRAVDSGNNLAWWARHTQGLMPTLDNSSQSSADWTQVRWEIASVKRPSNGHVHIFNEPRAFNIVNTNDKTQHPVGGGLTSFAASLKVEFAIDVKFDTLGTYVVDFSQETRNNNGTTGDTSDDVDYLATGRYTFHVGPIAELEVRDGGASPHAPADRNALTVFAFNNGPDSSLGARVTGLPTDAEALHISQGDYDATSGVWDLGELEDSDLLRARGFPGHATLVLDAAVDPNARVTIKNSVDYEVCIDSSGGDVSAATESACTATTGNTWHTTPVYDYITSNSKDVTITAARGTGGVGPGIPGGSRAQTGTTAVTWAPVQYLYGLPVVRYEVERLDGSSWTSLDDEVTGNVYADTAPSAGRDYRVRAVNVAGAEGPWSRSTAVVQAGLAGPPLNLRTQADGNNAIDVSWDAPEDSGGSAVTGYTVQWSSDGTGGWSNAGSTADQTFKHRGLQTGDVRWYRVAARNGGGLGHWSDPVMGQSAPGVPGTPTLKAKSLSDYEIELTWNEPKDNGEPITGYQIDWSSDGSADSWNGLADVSADPTSYVDSSLLPTSGATTA